MIFSKSTTTTALTYLGAVYAGVQAYKTARFVWRHYLRPPTNLQKRYGSESNSSVWAVVTGATSGIGLGCARVLASQGFDVVLIARTVADLEALAEELQAMHKIKTLIVPMDAATCDEDQLDDLVKMLRSKSVAILVNAVGIINLRPTAIDEMDFSLTSQIIAVNCSFTVHLTSKLVPLLKNHACDSGRRAAILNVGSLTSSSPFCYQSTYAASKAFDAHWSRCIRAELPPTVDVLCVRPGLTLSRMCPEAAIGGIVADPMDMAKRSLGLLGLSATAYSVLPYPPHALLDFLSTIIPEHLQESAVRSMNLERQREMDEEAKKKAEENMDTI